MSCGCSCRCSNGCGSCCQEWATLPGGGRTTNASISDVLIAVDRRYVPLTGGVMTGALTLFADPTTDLAAATKRYVDGRITQVLTLKPSVRDFATLPTVGNASGDVRVTLDTSLMYLWDGTAWNPLGNSHTPVPPGTNDGDYLMWTGSAWISAPSPLPDGTNNGDILVWDATSPPAEWVATPQRLGDQENLSGADPANDGGVIVYDSSGDAYVIRKIRTSDLEDWETTPATDGQIPIYDAAASLWVPSAAPAAVPPGNALGDVLEWDGTSWQPNTSAKSQVSDLGDLTTAGEAINDVLTYIGTGRYQMKPVPRKLTELTDVAVANPRADDGVIWSPTLSQWQNVQIATKQWAETQIQTLATGLAHEVPVVDIAAAPPAAPLIGESWIVGASPTGVFAGHVNNVATWLDDPLTPGTPHWVFTLPVVGETRWVSAQSATYTYNNSNQWVLIAQAQTAPGVVPVGGTVIWHVASLPADWLLCDGAAFDTTLYPALYRLLGTATVPDLRGQFVRGAGPGHLLGTRRDWTTGMPRNPFTTDNPGHHTHAYNDPLNDNTSAGGNRGIKGEARGADEAYLHPRPDTATGAAGGHVHTISGGDSETAPPHTVANYIIRAR